MAARHAGGVEVGKGVLKGFDRFPALGAAANIVSAHWVVFSSSSWILQALTPWNPVQCLSLVRQQKPKHSNI